MGVPKFQIVLDNTLGYYYAGTTVSGRILLWLDKPQTVRGLKIQIGGKASVHWPKTETTHSVGDDKKYNTMVSYSDIERYINWVYYLAGSDHDKITIAAGYEHVYPFSMDLPAQIPSSFDGKHGFIRYSVKIRLVRLWNLVDMKEKLRFNVINPIDLTYQPSARVPLTRQEQKNYSSFFSSTKNGPLILNVHLPQTGFVIGQDIPITVTITNNSNIYVDSVELNITEVEEWIVRNPRHYSRSYNSVIVKKILRGVKARDSKTFMEIINTDQIAVINLDGCSIINKYFYLNVKTHCNGLFRKGLSTKIPLIIGNVPIHEQEFPYSCPDRVSTFLNSTQQWCNIQGNYRTYPNMATYPGPTSVENPNPDHSPPYSVAIPQAFPNSPFLQHGVSQPPQAGFQSIYSQPIHSNGINFMNSNTSSLEPSLLLSNNAVSSTVFPTAPPLDSNNGEPIKKMLMDDKW